MGHIRKVLFLLITAIMMSCIVSTAHAAVSFVACGTAVAVGSDNMASVGIPAGIQNNDILITYIHQRDNVNSIMSIDWTNNVEGNGDTTNRLEIFWKRTTGSESAPTVIHAAGNSSIAQICALRGIDTTGDPFNVVGSVQSNSGSPISTAAITTTENNAMILHVFGSQDNNIWGSYTGIPTTEAAQNANNVGTDNSSALTYGLQTSAGSTGAAGATQTSFDPDAGVSVQMALRPFVPITTLGDGTDPSNSSIAPSASATDLDAFSLQVSSGTDTVTAATVTLSSGTFGGMALVALSSDDGSITYCSAANPASDIVSFSSCAIPVTTTQTQFKVRITPKSHANMPAPSGSTYTVTGTITSFTSTHSQAGTDTDSATITIDNASPANVTSASGSAGNQQVSLSWANPVDSDFHSVVVLRRASSAVTDTPTEGTTYTVGTAIGASTVACVAATPAVNCTDTGLTNGTAYHYKIFSRDTNVNYAAGVVPTGSPFTPAVPSDTTAPAAVTNLAASNSGVSTADLSWTAPGDDGNSGTATMYDLRYSFSVITAGNFSSATQVTGEPTPSVAGSSESMTVSGLSAGTTYYFALTSSDEVPNESALSNVPGVTTTSPTPTPTPTPSPTPTPTPTPPPTPEPSLPPSTGGGGAGGGVVPRRVVFSGQAYPASRIEVLRKSIQDQLYVHVPTETASISENGIFSLAYTGLISGDYLFALRAYDKDGRSTGAVTFDISVRGDLFEAKDIIMPPTIDFETSLIVKNNIMKMRGYAIANSKVELELEGSAYGDTKASQSGFWEFDIDTVYLNYGEHRVRVRQILPDGEKSNFSLMRVFKLSKHTISQVDLNADGNVNISDWSIFLFRWGSDNKELRSQNDLNKDGKINIFDFSMLLQAINSI